jgi:FkbM family methyltransferase
MDTRPLATHRYALKGATLDVTDYASSDTPRIVAKELKKDCYNIEAIRFAPGDVVIDIGANVGMVSIYIAKRFPAVRVLAFEPIPDNYAHLLTNIATNGVTNVVPHQLAITRDGRDFRMIVNFGNNSGGGTGNLKDMTLADHDYFTVKSATLDSVFETNGITACRLLKIDCEGAEHEILMNARCLDRVEYLSGEFHINRHLEAQGYSSEKLMARCREFIPAKKLKISAIRMAE